MMKVDTKDVGIAEFKVLDESEGIVEAIVSVTGVVDTVDDNILPGAYAKTLTARMPKGCWSHDWDEPIAKTLEAVELLPGDERLPAKIAGANGGGLLIKTQFNLDTQRGRDAYSDVKFFGDQAEWSIGYKVPTGKSRVDKKTGVREIEEIDLYEYSPVLFGAMPMANTVSVKSLAVDIAKELAADDDPDDELVRAAGAAYLALVKDRDDEEAADADAETPTPEPDPEPEGDAASEEDGPAAAEAAEADGDASKPGSWPRAYNPDAPKTAEPPPVEVATKEGRVLSGANRSKVTAAIDALQAVLDAATPASMSDDSEKSIEAGEVAEPAEFTITEADLLRMESLRIAAS